MPTEILERCDAIEECYEFMLAYAAQGLPNDETSPRVREFLRRAVSALDGLAESCRAAVEGSAFLAVADPGAGGSPPATPSVLAPPTPRPAVVGKPDPV